MSIKVVVRLALLFVVALATSVNAFAQMPNPYGPPVTADTAKKVAAVALAEAVKNHLLIAVAVVDPGGNLVYFEKMDNTQLSSSTVALDKARSSALWKRPTKAFQDALAAGGEGLRVLGLQGITPADGGYPLIVDGKIVGAIGASGATSAQDGQCAKAGADSLK